MHMRDYSRSAQTMASGYSRIAHSRTREYGRRARTDPGTRKALAVFGGLLLILVCTGLVLPKILPGGPRKDEAIIGKGGGLAVVNIYTGKSKQLLDRPASGETFETWAISPDRSRIIVAVARRKAGKVQGLSIQLRSAHSNRMRWDYDLPVTEFDMEDLQVGFVPGMNDLWLLSRGRLRLMDGRSGAIETAEVDAKPVPSPIAALAFDAEGDHVTAFLESDPPVVAVADAGFARANPEAVITLDRGQAASVAANGLCWLSKEHIVMLAELGASAPPNAKASKGGNLQVVDVDPSRSVAADIRPAGDMNQASLTPSPDRRSFAIAGYAGGAFLVRIYGQGSSVPRETSLSAGGQWKGPLCWAAP